MKKIKVFAPATVSNVGCGFDIMGFPLHEVGDYITINEVDEPGLHISSIEGAPGLSTDSSVNTATIAAQALLDALDASSQKGYSFEIRKMVKPGSGLGSSGSSAAAAVFGLNELLGRPFDQHELLEFAMAGEAAISGQPHADNVAPSLLGGFILVRGYDPLDVISLDYPEELYYSIVHPQIELKTLEARKLLGEQIPLRDAVTQWGNVGGLVSGLAKGDYDLIGRSLVDVVAEPVRAKLIPGFYEARNSAMNSGALGCSISGSGPSIFALCAEAETSSSVARVFKDLYQNLNIPFKVYHGMINPEGAVIIP